MAVDATAVQAFAVKETKKAEAKFKSEVAQLKDSEKAGGANAKSASSSDSDS